MAYDFGEIVLVPFPFTSREASKKRPAVVVSRRAYADTRPDVVIMAVTSQFRAAPALGEVWLDQWEAAGLLKPSVVKPVLATLEQSLVIRRLGTLASGDKIALRAAIAEFLG
jgi:mRNA interferase MazF